MNNITLAFYGRLRTQFAQQPLTIQTQQKTINALYHQLCEHHDIPPSNDIKPIKNDEFAEWEEQIKSGDEIGFLPPASGG